MRGLPLQNFLLRIPGKRIKSISKRVKLKRASHHLPHPRSGRPDTTCGALYQFEDAGDLAAAGQKQEGGGPLEGGFTQNSSVIQHCRYQLI